MRIAATGNTGIGTASTPQRFQVSGLSIVTGSALSAAPTISPFLGVLVSGSDTATGESRIFAYHPTLGSFLSFYTNPISGSGAEALRIQSDGSLTVNYSSATTGSTCLFDVVGRGVGNPSNRTLRIHNYDDTSGRGPAFALRRGKGNAASPTDVTSGNEIGSIFWEGWASSASRQTAGVTVLAEENFTSTAYGSLMQFSTTKLGTNTNVVRLTINNLGNFGFNNTSYGNGEKVFSIGNCAVVPNANPTGGGILYCESGALKYRGSSGTVTTIAAA
jgi:hypothetical protein